MNLNYNEEMEALWGGGSGAFANSRNQNEGPGYYRKKKYEPPKEKRPIKTDLLCIKLKYSPGYLATDMHGQCMEVMDIEYADILNKEQANFILGNFNINGKIVEWEPKELVRG